MIRIGRRSVAEDMRYLGSLLLIGVALTHIIEAREEEARYIVVLFVLLAAATVALAGCLALRAALTPAWAAAALLCATAIAGYVVSRAAGLPQMADDISNWGEPVGIAALACEAGVIALAARALGRRRGLALEQPLEAV